MFLSMIALAMAAQPCAKPAILPRDLRAWSRSGEGLDTRHATLFAPRGGKIETRISIRKAGIFGIAIDREGWIDVSLPRRQPLRMVSQNRGPACSGIRKIVRYRLQPGEYVVTVGKIEGAQTRLMLVHGLPASR